MAAAQDNLWFARGNRFPIWSYVKQDIKDVLCHEYDIDDSGMIQVTKRNKQLSRGDFLVVVPSLSLSIPSRSRVEPKAKNGAPCGDVATITDAEASANETRLEHIAWDKVRGIQIREATRIRDGEITIYLDRPAVFRAALERTVPQGLDRGARETESTVVVNPADAALSCDGEDITLCQLRTLLLSQHVSKLLQANGHNSILVPCAYSEKRSTQLQDCGLLVNEVIHRKTYLTEHPNTQEELVRKINFSCYLYSPDVATEEPDSSTRQIASQSCSRLLPDLGNESGTSTTTARRDNRMLLDLRAFMEDKKCVMLHKDYDNNLQLADVGPGTDIHSQLCALEQQVKLVPSQGPGLTIHVVSGQHSFRQQQVDLAWRILCETAAPTHQVHLVHAGVVTAGVTSFHQLFSERRKQMHKAAILKYGDHALEPAWQKKITALTMVGIQFQFLMTSCKHQVKLCGCDTDNESEMHRLPGVFVMYNYARLVTLLAHFDAAVKQGTYPAMPSLMDMDFGVLTDEDEWTLLFNYVLSFPSVVMETVSSISPNQLKADIQSHKICQFLCDLCRDLSSYYSRVRVLAKPQPKLLRVMYARICLLQAIAQVMRDSFALLNIQPISQL